MDRLRWKHILYTVGFTLPLLLGSWGIARLHLELRRSPPVAIPSDCQLVAVGDSHTTRAIDPTLLHPTAVNLSSPGENYMHNYYKLRYALNRVESNPTVVIPIDLHSFSDFRNHRVYFNLAWRPYLDYLQIGLTMGGLAKIIPKYFKLVFFGFRGDYRLLWDLLKGKDRPAGLDLIDGGFKPRPGTYLHKKEKKAAHRADRQLKGADTFSPAMRTYMLLMLTLCRERNCRVVLLQLPITSEYVNRARLHMSIRHYYQKIADLIQGRGEITILDYSRRFKKEQQWLFRDPQHLNEKGARLISTILRRDLLNRGLLHH